MFIPEPVSPLVLVVDDDYCSSLMLQSILCQEGLRAMNVADSESCLNFLKEQIPDLILLDVEFPEESGFSICRRIKSFAEWRDIPVLFISSNDNLDAKVLGFEVGGLDYITKPWQREEILARVKTHLRLRQALRNQSELQSLRLQRLKEAQEAILLKPCDEPEARFSVFFQPLQEVGGDFYDVISVGEEVFDYVVADISGHDVGMALVTSALKMLLRQNCSILATPVEILCSLNHGITSVLQSDQFVALTLVRINRKSGKAEVVCGGSPAPIYFSPQNSTAAIIDAAVGDLVGVFSDAAFKGVELKVSPGDRIFLYSDGILEMFGGENSGWRQKQKELQKILAAGEKSLIADLPVQIAREIAEIGRPQDDMVLMGIEI